MRIFAKSDIGMAREKNEDYYYIPEKNEELNLCILADGMGGYNGGEIASKIAVESSKNYIKNNVSSIQMNKEGILKLLKEAVEYSNMMVYEKAKTDAKLSEMGTTMDVTLIIENKLFIGHVGDSRVYLIRKNEIKRITDDHSYVQKLIKDGKITEEEALTHPDKNMLVKAIGSSTFVEPDLIEVDLELKDIILMCSDGLTNMLSDDEMVNIIQNKSSTKIESLIDMANEHGGNDNITAIIIENNN